MGCVSSKLSEPILKGDEEINYRAFAGPNHLVCLTSTTYGVFNNGSRKASDSSSVEATEAVETINAWELMDGLEDESPGPSPSVKTNSDKVDSLTMSVDGLDENRTGKSLGGSFMDGKKLGLDKENGRPKQASEPAKPNWVGPISSMKERNLVGKENFGARDNGRNVGSTGLVRDSVGSVDKSLYITKGRISYDDSLHLHSVGKENYIAKGRTSCDNYLHLQFVGKENFGPKGSGYNVGSAGLVRDIFRSTAPCDESLHIAKGRTSCEESLRSVGKENFQPLLKGYNLGIGGLPGDIVDTTPPYTESLERAKGRISHGPLAELRIESSRHFDFCDDSLKDCIGSSSPLFDPEMLASFETSLDNFEEDVWDDASSRSALKKRDPWDSYEEKCPPGGQDRVVLYTTTLRGIRKTFEDCNSVRCVLESYGICFTERDVSMHLVFRNELEKLMGRIVPVPRLFIKGRYIGGAGEVLELHEEGTLGELLEGIPADDTQGKVCDGCGGIRFVPCLECSGSCKLLNEEDNSVVRCPECNENGLIQCPICC